jgi:AcrR family transcriptional regulator
MSPRKRAPEATEELRASLIAHAQRLVARDGPDALTMRALATEAGCALGLPYKVFADRNELVLEVVHAELDTVAGISEELLNRAGTATVGANLSWFAQMLLASPAVGLAPEIARDDTRADEFAAKMHQSGIGPGEWETVFARYLTAEKRAGRIAADVNVDAFGFLLAGAIHNLIMSGAGYPRPTPRRLKRLLTSTAEAIGPR